MYQFRDSVAVILVGALHRETSSSPAAVLAGLNQVLCAKHVAGFVTCCCIWLKAGEPLRAASAGHVNPWLNAAELAMEPGLPLGVSPDAEYSESSFPFEASRQLTLVSDGVIEAANAKGELFGFERTREIPTKPAPDIANAAQAWGQNDDITLVTVSRAS